MLWAESESGRGALKCDLTLNIHTYMIQCSRLRVRVGRVPWNVTWHWTYIHAYTWSNALGWEWEWGHWTYIHTWSNALGWEWEWAGCLEMWLDTEHTYIHTLDPMLWTESESGRGWLEWCWTYIHTLDDVFISPPAVGPNDPVLGEKTVQVSEATTCANHTTCSVSPLPCNCPLRDAYRIACLGVTEGDWRILALEALEVCSYV